MPEVVAKALELLGAQGAHVAAGSVDGYDDRRCGCAVVALDEGSRLRTVISIAFLLLYALETINLEPSHVDVI
jgi:hypothetical protein